MSENSADFVPTRDDVFGRIAARYDRLCDLFSFGIHRLWKRRMACAIAVEAPGDLLDFVVGHGGYPLSPMGKTW